jgi:long-chain acyl-CoA synthetase
VADSNLATMHRRVARRLAGRTALRFKRYGLYHDVSWSEYRVQADRAAAGLIGLGIQAGDRVGILAENCADWLIADIAILSTGAADVPLHAPLVPDQVAYQLRHSGARGVIVSNQAQADKVAAVRGELPRLEWLASFAPVRVDEGIELRTLTWDGLKQAGWAAGAEGADALRRREETLTHADLATIIYTSGTTGMPKGVMLTHGNLLSNAASVLETAGLRGEDILLSWLPFSHIYARTVDHYLLILGEGTICLAESVDTLVTNLAETHPSWMTAVPRFYEKIWSSVEHLDPQARATGLRAIFGPRMRQLSSGGAPLPVQICEGINAAGIPLLEGYGLTESSPTISFNTHEARRCGTVGRALHGVEVSIADDGEVLTRGPHVMTGYWNDPEATRAAIDSDGWLHTGDVGTLDADGFLSITDRKKDLIITSGGKNIAPSELERLLTSDPCIDQAVVYGDRKPFVTALLVPNFARLGEEAANVGTPWPPPTDAGDLITCPATCGLLQGRVERLMRAVSQPERVKAFLVLSRPFQVDAGEMTATLKVRRRHILEKYHTRLDALYNTSSSAGP